MAKTSTPVRIDADLYEAATAAAPAMSRSTAQQISHWARIGKELEASPRISLRRVAAQGRPYAELDDEGKVVRVDPAG